MSEPRHYYVVTGWQLGEPCEPMQALSLVIQCKAGEFAIDLDATQAAEIGQALLAAVRPGGTAH